jgi:DNA repair protein REV1
MDCFFVSISTRDKHELEDKPVGVSHGSTTDTASSRTGVVASCNYKAREFGVRNGMYIGKALELCPDLVLIPYEFEKYFNVSQQLYSTLTPLVDSLEAVSCDEALIDVTSKCILDKRFPPNLFDQRLNFNSSTQPFKRNNEEKPTAFELAQFIHSEIFNLTKCNCSIGISSNILLARIANSKAKPKGMFFLKNFDLSSLILEEYPSIGHSNADKIKQYFNASTAGELLKFPKNELQTFLGPKFGDKIYNFIRGIDKSEVASHLSEENGSKRKSVSAEVNWGVRFETFEQVEFFLSQLSEEVVDRLTGALASSATFKLRIRHKDAPKEPLKFLGCGWCDHYSKTVQFSVPSNDIILLHSKMVKCLSTLMLIENKFDVADIRGLGIALNNLIYRKSASTILDMLKNSSKNKGKRPLDEFKESPTKKFVEESMNISNWDDIDPDVFNALPQTIQTEIHQQLFVESPSARHRMKNELLSQNELKNSSPSKRNSSGKTYVFPKNKISKDIVFTKKDLNKFRERAYEYLSQHNLVDLKNLLVELLRDHYFELAFEILNSIGNEDFRDNIRKIINIMI